MPVVRRTTLKWLRPWPLYLLLWLFANPVLPGRAVVIFINSTDDIALYDGVTHADALRIERSEDTPPLSVTLPNLQEVRRRTLRDVAERYGEGGQVCGGVGDVG